MMKKKMHGRFAPYYMRLANESRKKYFDVAVKDAYRYLVDIIHTSAIHGCKRVKINPQTVVYRTLVKFSDDGVDGTDVLGEGFAYDIVTHFLAYYHFKCKEQNGMYIVDLCGDDDECHYLQLGDVSYEND